MKDEEMKIEETPPPTNIVVSVDDTAKKTFWSKVVAVLKIILAIAVAIFGFFYARDYHGVKENREKEKELKEKEKEQIKQQEAQAKVTKEKEQIADKEEQEYEESKNDYLESKEELQNKLDQIDREAEEEKKEVDEREVSHEEIDSWLSKKGLKKK